MSTPIAEYYNELQRREGLEPVQLVAEWAQSDTDAISAAFRNAFAASRIIEQTIPIRQGSTNQSIVNQVADFFVPVINQHLQQYRIDACPGGGYPDSRHGDSLGETECLREILAIGQREFLTVKVADGRMGFHDNSRFVTVHTSHEGAVNGGDQAILKLVRVFAKVPDVALRVLGGPIERIFRQFAVLSDRIVDFDARDALGSPWYCASRRTHRVQNLGRSDPRR
jgi:hypothetical protein